MNRYLMYHSVGGSSSPEVGAGLYCVPKEKFREQMRYIAKTPRHIGLAGVPLSAEGTVPYWSARNSFDGDCPYKDRKSSDRDCPYLVTFDDGLVDNFTVAYPILKEFKLRAYFFILAGKVGKSGYMSWKQIKELQNAGMGIGSHGISHKILIGASDKELEYELGASKKILEEKLKVKVECLSIPRGFVNKKIIKKARELGYKTVFTSNPRKNDGFCIGRIPVKADWSIEHFADVLNNGLSLKEIAGELLKSSSKKVLGARNYDKLRSRILSRPLGRST